jgi:hypothetical protein
MLRHPDLDSPITRARTAIIPRLTMAPVADDRLAALLLSGLAGSMAQGRDSGGAVPGLTMCCGWVVAAGSGTGCPARMCAWPSSTCMARPGRGRR